MALAQAIQTAGTTVAEFDAFLDHQDDPKMYELIDGDIIMMSNPTETHNQIVNNINVRLKLHFDPRSCRTYVADIRVQRSERRDETDKPRPDVVVRCGPNTGKTFITDPIIVVETLSPSTMDFDRGPKLAFYKSLETMRHVILIYQDQMRLEHYRRTDEGWERDVLRLPSDTLQLADVAFSTAMADVYFGVEV